MYLYFAGIMNIAVFVLEILFVASVVEGSSTFKLILERIEVKDQHPDYVQAVVNTFKYNRTIFAVSGWFKFLQDCPPDTAVVLQAYEFLNNQYKPFAVYLKKKLCDYLPNEYKTFFYPGMPDMFPPSCPLAAGNYTFTDYRPRTQTFPTSLPFHRALLEIKFVTDTIMLFNLRTFATLDRDAVIRERYG